MDRRPILLLDFDGVVHEYSTPWVDALTISDGATHGFFEWAYRAQQTFRLSIYSSRSKDPRAIEAMRAWLDREHAAWLNALSPEDRPTGALQVDFPSSKPAAFLSIDDRAITFTGAWADFDPGSLRAFKPWNKRPPKLPKAAE